MQAVAQLHRLAWHDEARQCLALVAARVGQPSTVSEPDLRKVVALQLLEDPQTSVALLVNLASELDTKSLWQPALARALKRQTTTAEEAIALMNKLGPDIDLDDAYARVSANISGSSPLLHLAETDVLQQDRRGRTALPIANWLQYLEFHASGCEHLRAFFLCGNDLSLRPRVAVVALATT